MVLSDGWYSAPFSDAMMKDWVLRFKRARLLARERLCLLEAIMSEMNFLQSTQTSMAFQSSISSFGSSISSWDEDDCRVCLDNLREMEKRRYCQNCEIISCNYIWFCGGTSFHTMLGFCTWTLCTEGWVDGGSCWASLACERPCPVSVWTWTDPESKWVDWRRASMAAASKATEQDCYECKISFHQLLISWRTENRTFQSTVMRFTGPLWPWKWSQHGARQKNENYANI